MSQFGGHPMLNPDNKVIRVTQRTLRALDRRGYLKRDKSTGLLHLSKTHHLVFQEAERDTEWWHELGDDCSGANQVICRCQKCLESVACEADNNHINDIRTRQVTRMAS